MTTKVIVVYHSGYGHTKKQAEAVYAGAASVAGVHAELLAIDAEGNVPDDAWAKLAASQAIIFGSPTYMGAPSWQFKKFADASSKPWFGQAWKDKIAGGFTNSAGLSGDKLSTLHYFVTLAMQHSMIWVSNGVMPSPGNKPDGVNRLASFVGAMAQSDADAGPDVAPPSGDLATAESYGKRVAEFAARVNR